jgi:beta-fructofuranosidase
VLLFFCCGKGFAAEENSNFSWKRGDPQPGAAGGALAAFKGEKWTFWARLRSGTKAPDKALVECQSADRKRGFNLSLQATGGEPALRFDVAFDWSSRRNDHALQLLVPLHVVDPAGAHDIVVRFSGPNLEMFLDGVLVDEEWPVGHALQPDAEPIRFDDAIVENVSVSGRALSNQEIADLSGGTEAVARNQRALFGPERPVTQYWRPPGFNTWVGDCMPFFHEGRFHLFYLIDRHGHRSKWGLGAHQWAHVSSTDLLHWTHHPLAIGITDQAEGSICTGSTFASDGTFYGFYAVRTSDGSPARLTAAQSKDGIHFEKSDWSIALAPPYNGPPARDPMVFRDPATNLFHMLVTTDLTDFALPRRNGCLAHLTSHDLRTWEQQPPYIIPGFTDQPECSDWFKWNDWYYLVFSNNGVARYRISRSPHGPWLKPKFDVFDGPQARVLKTAAFTGNRRLGAAFLTQPNAGYAGHLVMREIIQNADGSLGTALPKEFQPPTGRQLDLRVQQLFGDVQGDPKNLRLESLRELAVAAIDSVPANFRLRVRVRPAAQGSFGICVRGSGRYERGHQLRFEPERQKVAWRNADADTISEFERSSLYNVENLDQPFDVEILVKDDILDASIAGQHTLISRAKPAFTGDRIFFSAQNGGITFENIELEPLLDHAE